MDLESFAHDSTKLNSVTTPQPAQQLCDGSSDLFHKELELTSRGQIKGGRWRSDGEKRWFLGDGEADLEVLTGGGVGGGEVAGVD